MIIAPLNVLLVEENPGDASLIKEELCSAHSKTLIQLEWANCLSKGLADLIANDFQAALVNLNLPDSKGLDTLQRILACAPQLPVIVITGEADEETGMQAVQAGAQDYLIKGQVDGRLMRRVIQYAIQRKQSEMQLADALEFTEHMLTASPVGILTYRLSGECVSANAHVAQMVGATVEGLKSQNFRLLESWKRSGLFEMAEEAIASKELTAADVHIVSTFGKEAWLRAQFVTFKSGGEELLLLTLNDISEHKLAEEALRESEENYRQLFDAESDAILLIDNETGRVLQANNAACVLYGYGHEELLTKKNVELSAEPEQTRHVTQETPVVAEQVVHIPLRLHRKKDGTVFPVEITGRFFLHHGGPVHIAAIRDITERKHAEAALEASEKRFRAWIENSSDLISVIDSSGIVQYQSPSVKRILDYTPEEVLGTGAFDLLHPEDQDNAIALFAEGVQQNPATRLPVESRIRHRDGSWRYMEAVGQMYVDEHGEVMALINSRDVTERRQAEAEVSAMQRRFQVLIENAPDGIALLGLDGKLRQVTPSTQRILGYTLEEAEGQDPALMTHPDDLPALLGLLNDLIQNPGQVVRMEYRFKHKDGSWRWLDSTISNLLTEPGVQAVVFNYRDVTESKRAEQTIKESEDRYRDLVEHIQDLLGTHDLQGNILSINPAVTTLLGIETDIMLTMNLRDVLVPEVRHQFDDYLATIQRDGRASGLMLVQTQSGERRIWKYDNTLRTDSANGPVVRAMARDVTEREQAEQALKEKDHLLSEAQRIGHIGSWSYDISNDTIVFSDEMYRLLDVLPEEFQHTVNELLALIYPSDRPAATKWLEDINSGAPAKEMDFRIFRKNGELCYLHCTGVVEFSPNGAPLRFTGTTQDVTERRLAEIQIQQQIKRLTALSEIDRAIMSSSDQHYTFGVVLAQVISQLQVDAADILLLDPDAQTLRYAAGQGFRTKQMESICVPIGESYAGRVARERHLIRIPDLTDKPNDPLFSVLVRDEGLVSYMGLPLIVKGKVRGVLEVFNRMPLQPYQEWFDFLNTLAGQAAIAVENTSLFGNLQASNQELIDAYDATIEGWSRAMDLRDRETEGHTQRVTKLTLDLARAMKMDESRLIHIRRGALLHDIGKLGVPDQILFKPGALTPEEQEIMQSHTDLAYEMLAPIQYLKPALNIPYFHHEKWDGTGYPLGLKGEQIPLEARIFAITDVWDALQSDRPYRKAWTHAETVEYIRAQSGSHFDPQVVDCFLEMVSKTE
jgi:PAS domain S-box-containing protein/putative nucleotidyltransferase with HDIG domain